MNNKRTSALCPLPSALCPLPDRQIVDANMLMLNAPCSMLNVQFFLTYAHTHTHMHFKKAPPSNRSFPRGPCGRCKGEDEVEAEAGEKEHRRRETGRSRFEGPRRRTLKTAIPALSMAASQRRGSRPERERERRLPGCCATSRSAARREWRRCSARCPSPGIWHVYLQQAARLDRRG